MTFHPPPTAEESGTQAGRRARKGGGGDILAGMTDPEIASIAAEILDSVSTDHPELQGRVFGEGLLKLSSAACTRPARPATTDRCSRATSIPLAAKGRRHRSDTIWQLCKVRFIEPAEPEAPRSGH